jgi:hypothetical protein
MMKVESILIFLFCFPNTFQFVRGISLRQIFNYTGSYQTFSVPLGVSYLAIEMFGAKGGCEASGGGNGARVRSNSLAVTPQSPIYIYIGGMGLSYNGVASKTSGGFNGGGNGTYFGSGGGGASDIRTIAGALTSRIAVAGGGGGCYSVCAAIGGSSALTGWFSSQKKLVMITF